MLKIELNATARADRVFFTTCYQALCQGSAGERRGPDVLLKEAQLLGALRALGGLPVGFDAEALPTDAIEPYELQESGALLLEEGQRKMLRECIEAARWPAAASQRRLDALKRLEDAERLPDKAAAPATS